MSVERNCKETKSKIQKLKIGKWEFNEIAEFGVKLALKDFWRNNLINQWDEVKIWVLEVTQ